MAEHLDTAVFLPACDVPTMKIRWRVTHCTIVYVSMSRVGVKRGLEVQTLMQSMQSVFGERSLVPCAEKVGATSSLGDLDYFVVTCYMVVTGFSIYMHKYQDQYLLEGEDPARNITKYIKLNTNITAQGVDGEFALV